MQCESMRTLERSRPAVDSVDGTAFHAIGCVARSARRGHEKLAEARAFAEEPAVPVTVGIGTGPVHSIAACAAFQVEDQHLLALIETLIEIGREQIGPRRPRRLLLAQRFGTLARGAAPISGKRRPS